MATTAAGNTFQVYWFAGSSTAEELDAARQAMNRDADYQGMIAQAGADGLFVDGSVNKVVLAKLPRGRARVHRSGSTGSPSCAPVGGTP